MTATALNIATASSTENSKAGLMICGINWGGSPSDEQSEEPKSFFSDALVNNYPYRNRLLTWFELFGHPLKTTKAEASGFERSIVQTNWLSTQSRNMNGKELLSDCISEWDNFEFHVKELQPDFIIFLSVTLLEVLNSGSCIDRARRLFGNESPLEILRKDVLVDGRFLKRFRIGIQNFGATTIIALPHPTGSRGLSNDYIRAFSQEIFPLFKKYKEARGF